MIRYAVDSLLTEPQEVVEAPEEHDATVEETSQPSTATPVDLLVFAVGDVTYGIPIEMVETVAAGLPIHPVPSTSSTLIGVTAFREELTEVHDGGTVLQSRPLGGDEIGSLLAVPGAGGRALITVSSVAGLSPAAETKWAIAPTSSPPWVLALAWTNERVITVIDPQSFNL